MIKKINILNCGSYKNYYWQNNLCEFKNINILYGYNGSGKTTLSRIMRSFELKEIHHDYQDMKFELDLDGNKLNQNDIKNENLNIRVFNKDFINDNLNFLINGKSNGNIRSFSSTILGQENQKIIKDIEIFQSQLNDIENIIKQEKENKSKSEQDLNKIEKEVSDKLTSKAKDIKTKLRISNSYNKINISNDIKQIKENFTSYRLSDEDINKYENILKDEEKENLYYNLKFDKNEFANLYKSSKEIIETNLIQKIEIENNLRKWLEEGLNHHSHEKEVQKCKFCDNELSKDRIKWLLENLKDDKKENLSKNLSYHIELIYNFQEKIKHIKSYLEIDLFKLYSDLRDDFKNCTTTITKEIDDLLSATDKINSNLKDKSENLYKNIEIYKFVDNSEEINALLQNIKELFDKNNKKTQNLKNDKEEANNQLKFNIIANFLEESDFLNKEKEKTNLQENISQKEEEIKEKEVQKEKINDDIDKLKSSISSEEAGAEKINEYLKSYFGYDILKFKPVKDNKSEFQIYRNEIPASNLSEGECSLLAFCYFIAKLNDNDITNENTIIWIDDPISSLDSNHIFFIFSLIKNELFNDKKLKYNQLFISTHNLDFLKYLKTFEKDKKGNKQYYCIEKLENKSTIKEMPKFIKHYTTEFNYLFEQIYNFKNIDGITDEELKTSIIYNFGNNLRKFLEVFLFFKFPTKEDLSTKLDKYFNKIEATLINRYMNEYSHLKEIVERCVRPVDIPEAKKIAEFVLKTMESKDKEQYDALCESIN